MSLLVIIPVMTDDPNALADVAEYIKATVIGVALMIGMCLAAHDWE